MDGQDGPFGRLAGSLNTRMWNVGRLRVSRRPEKMVVVRFRGPIKRETGR